MKNKYLFGYIYFLALLTIAINIFYTYELFGEFIKNDIQNNYKEILISAIALEISWIVLFIWFVFEPIQRKEILLLTTIPMIIANILNNYTLELIQFLTNLLFLGLFISLYFIGYYLLNNLSKKVSINLC
jgi:hypothetical protein